MFIPFWLCPSRARAPSFARHPGGAPSCSSCSSCSALGSAPTAVQWASTCVPHWESGFPFPLAAFRVVIVTKGCSLTWLSLMGSGQCLINAFFGKMVFPFMEAFHLWKTLLEANLSSKFLPTVSATLISTRTFP